MIIHGQVLIINGQVRVSVSRAVAALDAPALRPPDSLAPAAPAAH